MNAGDALGSYILDERIGKGLAASTWLAHRTDGSKVVLKLFDLAETSSWSSLDVFRREADALRTLSHPGIPQYFESFELALEDHLLFAIAMEYIPGETLENLIRSGRKLTEDQIEDILAQLADILDYIGSLRPPIVHRDINPRNVILRPDGRITLVDFSGVQDAIRTALYPGATLVGTAGFMPVEQVSGRATHRSDLYGAAATAVFLLTGRNPAELPMRNLKIELEGLLYMSPRLSHVLNNWLDPDPDRRTLSARDAAAILRGKQAIPSRSASRIAYPRGGREEPDFLDAASPRAVNVPTTDDNEPGIEDFDGPYRNHPAFVARRSVAALRQSAVPEEIPDDDPSPVELPTDSKIEVLPLEPGIHIKLPRNATRPGRTGPVFFPIFWLGFVAFWTMMTIRMRAPFIMPLFSIPFWIVGVAMTKLIIGPRLTDTEISLTADGLVVRRITPFGSSSQQWPLSDVGRAFLKYSKMEFNHQRLPELGIETGTDTLSLGTGLSMRELVYLSRKLNQSLRDLKQQS